MHITVLKMHVAKVFTNSFLKSVVILILICCSCNGKVIYQLLDRYYLKVRKLFDFLFSKFFLLSQNRAKLTEDYKKSFYQKKTQVFKKSQFL